MAAEDKKYTVPSPGGSTGQNYVVEVSSSTNRAIGWIWRVEKNVEGYAALSAGAKTDVDAEIAAATLDAVTAENR